jgi:hypothetical protein
LPASLLGERHDNGNSACPSGLLRVREIRDYVEMTLTTHAFSLFDADAFLSLLHDPEALEKVLVFSHVCWNTEAWETTH